MKEVRIGIIGVGGMGNNHVGYFPKVNRLKLTAIADIEPAKLTHVTDKHPEIKPFNTGEELLDSGLVDAVLIATPHYFHPVFAQEAFKRGIHVMSEKPVAVTAKAAAETNAAHEKVKDKVIFSAMFQQRTTPSYQRAKEMIAAGELGEIRRTNWIVTDWFRSQRYYDSGGWRATWGGEGGGVLLNQCPHNLDLFQWLCGKPSKIQAFMTLGKYHHIEVEDDVTAYLEYPNGATGVFITTTGEAPGTNRLEITGDRGKIIIESGRTVEFHRTSESVKHILETTPQSFPGVTRDKLMIEVGARAGAGAHQTITENFVAAILDGEPLIAPATEGIHSVEMANAMIQSGITGKAVDLPMDREGYDTFLKGLVKNSTFKKAAVKEAKADMAASFK